jgi:hypothetical protein
MSDTLCVESRYDARYDATPSSAFYRMRVCVSVRAAAFPFDSSSAKCARSLDVNVMQYRFIALHFTGTKTTFLQCWLDGTLAGSLQWLWD